MSLFHRDNPLQRAYDRAAVVPERGSVAAGELKLILFSDVHKGMGDGADQFRRCEPTYDAALEWYYEHGFRLALLGDVEELWECTPAEVVAYHGPSLEREAAFFREGRYIRVYGNHDDIWRWQWAVNRHLGPIFNTDGRQLVVHGAVRVRLSEHGGDDPDVFELLLTHGNQGTIDSDLLAPVSHLFLRTVVHPLKAHLRFSTVTPADTWTGRKEQDRKLRGWAAKLPGHPVLVAGHTHQPVFPGTAPAPHLPDQRDGEWKDPDHVFEEAERRRVQDLAPEADDGPPCYFNAGACSYGDGELTGIEIAGGEIRLVRWTRWHAALTKLPDGRPEAEIHAGPDRVPVANAKLMDVLRAVRDGHPL